MAKETDQLKKFEVCAFAVTPLSVSIKRHQGTYDAPGFVNKMAHKALRQQRELEGEDIPSVRVLSSIIHLL